MKRDLRPIEVQLGLDSNEVLESDPELKVEVIELIKSYPYIWAFYGENKTYGLTDDIKFSIELFDPKTKPIRHKFRILNDLQIKSLETQIQEWSNNHIVKIFDVVPNDGWVSSFVPVLKPHKNEKPTIRWVSDFRPLNEHTGFYI